MKVITQESHQEQQRTDKYQNNSGYQYPADVLLLLQILTKFLVI